MSKNWKAWLRSPAGQAAAAKIADIARHAAEAAQHAPGAGRVDVSGHTIHCLPGGMCDRFARECHEAATGHDWPFRAATAHATEALLIRAGRRLSGPIPGAVGCWGDSDPGHIVVALTKGMVAENTSSAHRGSPSRPGTKITPLEAVRNAHDGEAGRWYWAGEVPG